MIPVLPLRDVVIFPNSVTPLFVGRPRSIKALNRVMQEDSRQVFLVAQKDGANEDPDAGHVHDVGTVATILHMLKMSDSTVKIMVQGQYRARVETYDDSGDFLSAQVSALELPTEDPQEIEVLARSLLTHVEQYAQLNKKMPSEIVATLSSYDDIEKLIDNTATHINIRTEHKQAVLEIPSAHERLGYLIARINEEIELLQVEKRIRGRIKQQMEKSQREYYLNEQMKAIQKELGDEESVNENEDLAKKIKSSGMPKDVREKAKGELDKLKMMSPMSSEANVVRSYIDWLIGVPWKKRTRIGHDINKAEDVLEADHYGLEKVKERILEYLAVQSRVKKIKGPILCLVGPPGVGKTSLGKSIARATSRKFTRMSLGGVRDEAEIRGHRRTYVGALPGKIVQNLAKVGVRNPLFLLDEVDKISMDFRGDPSSALLEVLDPEQNHAFNDHYLDVDYDLSEVMFVATANTLDIAPPLLDRMEVIRLSGYTEDEKLNIAERYLLPRQKEDAGLEDNELDLTSDAIRDIVRHYTREAGVRGIDREIARICRKVVRKKVSGEEKKGKILVEPSNLEEYLGVRKYRFGHKEEENRVGQVTGLAWTEVGGDLLTIEAAVIRGRGQALYTGQLGEVMQESIQAAMTVVRSRANVLGIAPKFYQRQDVHIHVPEGATPKDGPSAGIGMCTALVSALTGIAVRSDVAMTGEITLRGEVLPIGGLKEKLLAALRGGIKMVLIPEENVRELPEIPDNIKDHLDIRPVKWIDQVLELALVSQPSADADIIAGPVPDSTEGKEAGIERGLTAH
ncbi:endopeptidase La [Thioalkalivibrio sp. HK1]|uniref:endopeptidase La n=1 Tax=Thioalkalivibrio sp. HK1 TaxID=1469245 RepID=UPI0004705487|nr:endopeptidase La [Thioalkalivibrio sp. HK1]